jgi:predicted amidohydrolase
MGRIRGMVLLAPTCPVEQASSPCPPRPLSRVLVRVVDANGEVLADATSDDAGAFELTVRPGSYVLTASIDEDPARSVRPARVHVVAGEVVHANVLVDSGIR